MKGRTLAVASASVVVFTVSGAHVGVLAANVSAVGLLAVRNTAGSFFHCTVAPNLFSQRNALPCDSMS